MTRPLVNEIASRIWPSKSHFPLAIRAGVMNLVQMSRSLSAFFSAEVISERPSRPVEAMPEGDWGKIGGFHRARGEGFIQWKFQCIVRNHMDLARQSISIGFGSKEKQRDAEI